MNRIITRTALCAIISLITVNNCSASLWDWFLGESLAEQLAKQWRYGNGISKSDLVKKSGYIAQRQQLANQKFTLCDLTKARFDYADIHKCLFVGAHCPEMNMQHADARETNFFHANLPGVNAAHANMQRASLMGVDGRSMDLSYVDARGTDFRGGDFRAAHIYGMQVDAQTKIHGARFGWRRYAILAKIAYAATKPYALNTPKAFYAGLKMGLLKIYTAIKTTFGSMATLQQLSDLSPHQLLVMEHAGQ